jgi:hypothetical protein
LAGATSALPNKLCWIRYLFAKTSLFCAIFSKTQQLWIKIPASEYFSGHSAEEGMRIWRAMKVFYEIVTDREVYFLLGLAIRDIFRKTKSDPKPAIAVKKRAKAMSAGRS